MAERLIEACCEESAMERLPRSGPICRFAEVSNFAHIVRRDTATVPNGKN
jgi:hypothetical protein